MDISFFLTNILLGIGLAMDAFTVSLADGLAEPKMKKQRVMLIAGTFALFQALMPMIGWVCVHTVVEHFKAFEKFIPYIALALLALIGGNMIREGLSCDDEKGAGGKLGLFALFVQGVATSIDALSVGFTIAHYTLPYALTAAALIAAVTLVICIFGVEIGKRFGTALSGKAEIVGGIILIGIGIEILLKSFFAR